VTFCTLERRVLTPNQRDIALNCCVHDHRITYWLHCAVVMPDHVHMIFTPYDFQLPVIMKRVKGVSARFINAADRTSGVVWQGESFDHILRSDEDLMTKAEYVCNNPVRAGLVASIDDYRWIWRSWIEGAGRIACATLR
ncbi:MAG TPA: transposase, partial [Thermoanaerobaculia bacterium]